MVNEGWDIYESLAADLVRPGLSLLLFAKVLALGEMGCLQEARDAAQALRDLRTALFSQGDEELTKIGGGPEPARKS